MIGRAHRFHGHGSLRHVYARGQIVRGQYFALKHLATPHRKRYRAAVVVSKKVHKSAVVRNRIRRRIYEGIRLAIDSSPPPTDLVFIVYSEHVATMSTLELHEQIRSHLQKAGVATAAEAQS